MAIECFNRPEDESRYLDWLAANSAGFVVNTNRPNASASYLKLHSANCRSISELRPGFERFTGGSYQKVCSTDLAELQRWARNEVGGELDGCALCRK